MKTNKILIIASLLLCFSASLFLASCSARLPKPKSAGNVINHHFHKYGCKFKASDFGVHKVEEVAVIDVQEIHKHLAAVTANIRLHEGPIYMVRCVLEKKATGWKFVSWEKI